MNFYILVVHMSYLQFNGSIHETYFMMLRSTVIYRIATNHWWLPDHFGAWLSLAERRSWVPEAVGSSPTAPTIQNCKGEYI